jgi:hypothetical protein
MIVSLCRALADWSTPAERAAFWGEMNRDVKAEEAAAAAAEEAATEAVSPSGCY